MKISKDSRVLKQEGYFFLFFGKTREKEIRRSEDLRENSKWSEGRSGEYMCDMLYPT